MLQQLRRELHMLSFVVELIFKETLGLRFPKKQKTWSKICLILILTPDSLLMKSLVCILFYF